MAYQLWSQDIFSKGELSPFMYARATVTEYGNGLKTAQNVFTYPTGAAGKRFGTLFQSFCTHVQDETAADLEAWQYFDECIYQLLFTPGFIDIFLEGVLIATVTTTMTVNQIRKMITTILSTTFRVTTILQAPFDLKRSATTAVITSISPNSIAASSAPFTVNTIVPVSFTVVGGTILQTTPQLLEDVVYFAVPQNTTTVVLFETAQEAKFYFQTGDLTDAIKINSAGTGTTTIHIQNTWTFAKTVFKNLPVYDFNGTTTSYDTLTFTPSATTGAAVTITVSGAGYAPLDSSYVGGAFIGAGGTSRITAVASPTSFTVAVENAFDSTNPIQGSLVFLAEPAWSDKRGWPQVCSSYQNRACFANTRLLENGFWASVSSDYSDFGDLTNDDDDAISWFPTSNDINFIRFIVPYRSLTVHTNSGIYSSPLSDVSAITPSNFTLQLQDSTPADVLLPQAIDNQILVLSGNDAHQLLWDGINNAYVSNIVSIISEQLINSPVDETAFADLHRAGSRYVFIVNADGSMAVFQTLISESVAGFTPQILEQSYGNAGFIQVASVASGRAWFLNRREIATLSATVSITGFTAATPTVPSTLHAVSSNLPTNVPTAITFITTGTLPASSPQITTTQYYWAVGVTNDDFQVFLSQDDALAGVNQISFTSAGTSSSEKTWLPSVNFTLEELTTDVFLDCAVFYDGTPTSTVNTGTLFNAQDVKMIGDGFGFNATGFNNQVQFNAHGELQQISEAYIGFPINTIIEPMPLTIASGPSAKETTLTKPKHIRSVRFMFNNTIGGTINGIPIALEPFNMAHIGDPPFPARGFVELSVMKGWEDFNNPTYTIEHNEPFNIELLGVFYSVDI